MCEPTLCVQAMLLAHSDAYADLTGYSPPGVALSNAGEKTDLRWGALRAIEAVMNHRPTERHVVPLLQAPRSLEWTNLQNSSTESEDILSDNGKILCLTVVGRIRKLYVLRYDEEFYVETPRLVVEPLRQRDLMALHSLLRRVGSTNHRDAFMPYFLFTSNINPESVDGVLTGVPHVSPRLQYLHS